METRWGQKMVGVCVCIMGWMVNMSFGDVIIISTHTNATYPPLPDAPARFGPSLPLDGFQGFATQVFPPDACKIPKPPPPRPTNFTGKWIGIVTRSKNCSFDQKVLNCQIAGFDAVIVHNVGSDTILPMGINSEIVADKITIPSVFIGQTDGMMIIDNFLYNKGFVLDITDDFPFNLQSYLVPFAITIGICFIVMLSFMVVKCVRDYRRSRRHRLSSRALRKLPTHKFKKGDPYECCAICLEDYADNDKLRILPCEHAYHTKCIDPWLTKNRRVCPVCKRKVFTGDERPSDHDSDSEDEGSPLINSEGGTQGGTFTPQRENPFQEAERLAEERRRRRRRRGPSRNIECGPEGYQRLVDSTDDEEEEEEEEEESDREQATEVTEPGNNEVDFRGVTASRPMCASSPLIAAPSRMAASPRFHPSPRCGPPTTISVMVHDIANTNNPQTITDSSSICSNTSQGSPPGPVQIAVDVVNSPPPSATTSDISSTQSPTQSSQQPSQEPNRSDYVV